MNETSNKKDLARRIEALEVLSAVETLETFAKHERPPEVSLIRVSGGVACYGGPASFLNKALGLGMRGPVSPAEFDRLEAFFRRRGVSVQIELCPLADPSLLDLVRERNYRLVGEENVFCRSLEGKIPAIDSKNITVEKLGADGEDLYAQTLARGFLAAEGSSFSENEIGDVGLDGLVHMIRFSFRSPSSICFLGRCENEPAGGGVLIVHGKMAGVYGASTIPQFRRRGVQAALLQARLAAAKLAGCEFVATTTLPGSTSHRNIERAGFKLAYTKQILVANS